MLSVYIVSSSMSVIFFKTELNQLLLSKLASTDWLQYKFQISQHCTKVTIQSFPSIVFLCPNPVYLDHVGTWKLCKKCPVPCPKYISSLYSSLNLLMTCLHSRFFLCIFHSIKSFSTFHYYYLEFYLVYFYTLTSLNDKNNAFSYIFYYQVDILVL